MPLPLPLPFVWGADTVDSCSKFARKDDMSSAFVFALVERLIEEPSPRMLLRPLVSETAAVRKRGARRRD